tara:strand:- start:278 stop:454 length:177 start_codon:yes stop_codon:yes gene_type:complete
MSSKVNQYFKNKIKSMTGSISDKEKEFIENNIPNDMSNFKGSVSDKEIEFLKKLLPNK